MNHVYRPLVLLVSGAMLGLASPAIAGDNACETLAAGLCDMCGEQVCTALTNTEPPSTEECAEALGAMQELAEEAERLSEEDQATAAQKVCAELAPDTKPASPPTAPPPKPKPAPKK